MGFCRMIGVLLWKHAVVRKNTFYFTIAEIVIPFLFFSVLIDYYQEKEDLEILKILPVNTLQSIPRVLYTPYTSLTSTLMSEVGRSLRLPERNGNPNHITSGYWGVGNTSVLDNFMANMKYNEAIVIFEDLHGETLPQNLNYTIRMKEPFLTSGKMSLDGILTRHSSFGDNYGIFMNVQWAIDKSYLKLRTGSDLNQEVTFQKFPYEQDGLAHANWAIIATMLSMSVPFALQVSRLTNERASEALELIKISGVTTNMVVVSHFLNTIPSALMYSIPVTVFCKVSDYALFPQTNFVFVFVAMFLHYCNIMAMAYPVSYILYKHSNTLLTVTWYILLALPMYMSYRIVNGHMVYFTGLFPSMPINWFYEEIIGFEMVGKSIHITDIATKQTIYSAPILCALVFILLQTALFVMIAWYLDKVRTGDFGVALPWNFLCMKSYWSKNMDTDLTVEVPRVNIDDPLYFELPPKNHKVGIKVVDVSKIYETWNGSKNTVLSHMTVNFNEGEITMLLGRNGAGKSTLMSIITGIVSSTRGHVLVKGMDNIKRRDEVRRHLGFCPQNNISFSELTVLQNVMLFSMLRGLDCIEAKIASLQLITGLKLESKMDSITSELSGGMKRLLQLACALAGNATVLILDEPTSGLDMETRRELWKLILNLRGTCTVVITTHYMEEADALGDRVVAIHQGKLYCRATPTYLKKTIGTGYGLSLTLKKSAKESTITNIISKHVSGAAISDRAFTRILYRMPEKSRNSLPNMFNDLERHRRKLGIETIGVGSTTMDEVFLKLCGDIDTDKEVDETHVVEAATFDKLSGFPLWWRILKVLIKRRFIATLSVKWFFLIVKIIVPVLAICLYAAFEKSEKGKTKLRNQRFMLNLDEYKETGVNGVLLDISDKDSLKHIRSFAEVYPDFEFVKTTNISEVVLRSGMYNYKYLIGLETSNTNANLRYTTQYRHAAPVALNLYSNFRALQLLPNSSAVRTITTYNYPIEGGHFALRADFVDTKTVKEVRNWVILVTCIIMSTLIIDVILPCKEREWGSRHIQIMSGCSPVLYWLATLIYDYIIYLAVTVVVMSMTCMFLDKDKVYLSLDFIGTLVLILTLGGLALLMFVYCISFVCTVSTAIIVLLMLLVLGGFILVILDVHYEGFILALSYLFLQHQFVTAVHIAADTARANSVCRLNVALCPNIVDTYSPKFAEVCCSANLKLSTGPFAYIANGPDLHANIIALAVNILIYGILVFIFEYRLFITCLGEVAKKHCQNDLVTEEEKYCEKSVLKNAAPQDAVLVHNLHKKYMKCPHDVYAVRGISFSVKKGECFGVMGTNGSGKSTTFQMLSAMEQCTRGTRFANGYNISERRSEYLYSMAYCPQFGGLDMFLTGEQNLRQLLVIRGLRDSDVHNEVNFWFRCVDLQQYAKLQPSCYSGGCLRRLSIAMALSSGAPISLLDEPTTGVDIVAQRSVWLILKRVLAQKRSIIISSHSMHEIEVLCNRIAIMSHGEICALGSSPVLRAAHGVALSLRLKLKPQDHVKDTTATAASTSSGAAPVENMKTDLMNTYPGKVHSEFVSMLYYQMNNKVPFSEIFNYMEQLRTKYPDTLEEYSITETTLEEVFLSLVRDEVYDDDEDNKSNCW